MTDDEPHEEPPADDDPSTDESRDDGPSEGESPDERVADADTPDDGEDRPDEVEGTPGDTDAGEDDGVDGNDDTEAAPSRRADDTAGEGDGKPDEGADAPPDGHDELSVEPSETLDGDGGDGSKTLGERLHEFAVDLLETGTAAGSDRGGRISYGYTARTGPRGPASPHRRRRPSRGRGSPDADAPDAPDAHTSVARDDDGVHVTVDLPGVDPDDLTVGVDPERDALVVAVGGTVLTRVPLEGTNQVDDCWLNNDVLTVHLTDP